MARCRSRVRRRTAARRLGRCQPSPRRAPACGSALAASSWRCDEPGTGNGTGRCGPARWAETDGQERSPAKMKCGTVGSLATTSCPVEPAHHRSRRRRQPTNAIPSPRALSPPGPFPIRSSRASNARRLPRHGSFGYVVDSLQYTSARHPGIANGAKAAATSAPAGRPGMAWHGMAVRAVLPSFHGPCTAFPVIQLKVAIVSS
jgi:hypothetical protein